MRLLVISATPHYRRDGRIVGHGPTVTEISHLTEIFDDIVHLCLLDPDEPPPMALPYASDRVRVIPMPAVGGLRLRDKLDIARQIPRWLRAMWCELPQADVVHVRCPANISLVAILWLALARHPQPGHRWVKYAGNWKPDRAEARSYTFQRWWLEKGLHRGKVSVNGQWPGQPRHVYSFINPCITDEELEAAAAIARAKTMGDPLRLLFVGLLRPHKGAGRALDVVRRLRDRGIPVTYDLVGEGENKAEFEQRAVELGLDDCVTFHGLMSRQDLNTLYARSHIMLFPTDSSEGWPKILSESMAYGVVPVTSRVSSIPQHLERFKVGQALDPYDLDAYVEAIAHYYAHPEVWQAEVANGLELARAFSYTAYLRDVRELLEIEQ